MKHITVAEHGSRIGVHGERLSVYDNESVLCELPLNRIKTVTVCNEGVSISSNAVLACARRGIKMFILDYRGIALASLTSPCTSSIYKVRQKQFEFTDKTEARLLSSEIISSKIRNQRALLKYYGKAQQSRPEHKNCLDQAGNELALLADKILSENWTDCTTDWRSLIMGLEGRAAKIYWNALIKADLLPSTFIYRQGRHAGEICNQALNFGYAILSSHVWQCLLNAGLEIHAGFLHTFRPGKPSLVLDLMEEYRAFITDRAVIKNRSLLDSRNSLVPEIKKRIVSTIHEYFGKTYSYRGKQVKLENILQRQCYRLAAHFLGAKTYKPFHFPW